LFFSLRVKLVLSFDPTVPPYMGPLKILFSLFYAKEWMLPLRSTHLIL
jgi:hypothetical protein